MKLKELPEEDLFTSGHSACPGCGAAIIARIALKVFGPKTIVYMPANCMLIFTSLFPQSSFKVPSFDILFENSAVCAASVKRVLKRRGRDDVNVVVFAGDGGTADIGIQALSGAAERNEDIIYVCYDNEAYMNTGIQRSGATPFGAWTTTTPVGSIIAGKAEPKKDMPAIIIAHNVPYVATASLSNLIDLLRKLEKARDKKGLRYLQILAPCPTGWKMDSSETIEMSRLAVETGVWPLIEYEDGKLTISKEPRMLPVEDYLKRQGRFRHLKPEDVEEFKGHVEQVWKRYRALSKALA